MSLKPLRWIIEITGLVYLAAFVMNTGLLWFFMRASVACRFIDTGIVYIRCGSGLSGRILDSFLFYFSPLIAPVVRMNWNRLFNNPEPVHYDALVPVYLFFAGYCFVIFSSLWVMRKIVRGFVRHKKYPEGARHSGLMLLAVIIPSFISYGVRLYIVPPKFAGGMINVDIWHGEFAVPRGLLDEWTLVHLIRPSTKPDTYGSTMTRKWRNVPYLEFDFPQNTGIAKVDEISKIHVNPHYNRLNAVALVNARKEIAENRFSKRTAATNKLAYSTAAQTEMGWEVHQALDDPDDTFPDIYIRRNDRGEIENLLACTPAKACAVKARFAWSYYECGRSQCDCRKICTDFSQGNLDYDVVYSFDKKYLDRYQESNDIIFRHIAKFYTPK